MHLVHRASPRKLCKWRPGQHQCSGATGPADGWDTRGEEELHPATWRADEGSVIQYGHSWLRTDTTGTQLCLFVCVCRYLLENTTRYTQYLRSHPATCTSMSTLQKQPYRRTSPSCTSSKNEFAMEQVKPLSCHYGLINTIRYTLNTRVHDNK